MHQKHPDCIDLEKCKDRYLYKLRSRNLSFGVFREKDKSFIGIRTKFGSRFLDNEYHWDTGPPYGTASPVEEMGLLDEVEPEASFWRLAPSHIRLWERYPDSECLYCGKLLHFEEDPEDKPRGTWKGCSEECTNASPQSREYTPLFSLLKMIEKREDDKRAEKG